MNLIRRCVAVEIEAGGLIHISFQGATFLICIDVYNALGGFVMTALVCDFPLDRIVSSLLVYYLV